MTRCSEYERIILLEPTAAELSALARQAYTALDYLRLHPGATDPQT